MFSLNGAKEEFVEWLKSDKAKDISSLFRKGDATTCPVAYFLKSHGYVEPYITQARYVDTELLHGWGEQTPKWAKDFIQAYDTSLFDYPENAYTVALKVVDKLWKENGKES